MRNLITILLLLLTSFTLRSQGINNSFTAYANTLDSLYTHAGLQDQPIFVKGRTTVNDGYGAWYYFDATSTLTTIPYLVFPLTGHETEAGRWIAIKLMGTSLGLPLRMSRTERLAIRDKEEGTLIYDTTRHRLYVWNGRRWKKATCWF